MPEKRKIKDFMPRGLMEFVNYIEMTVMLHSPGAFALDHVIIKINPLETHTAHTKRQHLNILKTLLLSHYLQVIIIIFVSLFILIPNYIITHSND